MNSLELKDKINQLNNELREMVDSAKEETRKLSKVEDSVFNQKVEERNACKEELRRLKEELESKTIITNNKKETRTMKSNFMNVVNSIVNGQSIEDEVRNAYNVKGNRFELRANIVAASSTAVGEEVDDIIPALRANNAAIKAGAKFLTGLQGNVKIPVISGASALWEGETDAAADGAASIGGVTLSPKRLATYVNVSKQLLIQSTPDVEAALKADLANAINEKLEKTIFSANHGNDAPDGMFYNVTVQSVNTYKKLLGLESTVEDGNVTKGVYVMSPKAKASLRSLAKGTGDGMAMVNGEVDGVPAFITTACETATTASGTTTYSNNCVFGDFSNLVIGQFGNVEVEVVSDATLATSGLVRLLVNGYFDFAVLRAAAFAYGTIA